MSFGKNLKAQRIQMECSRRELAKRAGCTVRAISWYENGKRTPNVLIAVKIADALETTCEELVRGIKND